MVKQANCSLPLTLKGRPILAEHSRAITEIKMLRGRRLPEMYWRRGTTSSEQET